MYCRLIFASLFLLEVFKQNFQNSKMRMAIDVLHNMVEKRVHSFIKNPANLCILIARLFSNFSQSRFFFCHAFFYSSSYKTIPSNLFPCHTQILIIGWVLDDAQYSLAWNDFYSFS